MKFLQIVKLNRTSNKIMNLKIYFQCCKMLKKKLIKQKKPTHNSLSIKHIIRRS